MKKIFALIIAAAQLVGCHSVPASNVTFGNFTDGYGNPVNRNVTTTQLAQPVVIGGGLAWAPPKMTIMTNYSVTVSNLTGGNWFCGFYGLLKPVIIAVPPNDTNTWNYTSLIVSNSAYYGALANIFAYWPTNLNAWSSLSPSQFDAAGAAATAMASAIAASDTNGAATNAVNAFAALGTNYNFTITASGAGDSGANGVYYPWTNYTATSLQYFGTGPVYTNAAGWYLGVYGTNWAFYAFLNSYYASYLNPNGSTNGFPPPTTGWTDNGDIDPPPTLTIATNAGTPYFLNLTPGLVQSDPANTAAILVAKASANYYNTGNAGKLDLLYNLSANSGWLEISNNQSIVCVPPTLLSMWGAGVSSGSFVPLATVNTNFCVVFGGGTASVNGNYTWVPFSGTRTNMPAPTTIYSGGVLTNAATGDFAFYYSPYWYWVTSAGAYLYRGGINGSYAASQEQTYIGGGNPAPYVQWGATINFGTDNVQPANVPASSIIGGLTTNLQFTFGTTRTNTLYFTNGVLMNVSQP